MVCEDKTGLEACKEEENEAGGIFGFGLIEFRRR